MECSQRQLRAGLANRLSRNDAHSRAKLDHPAAAHVHTVTLLAHTKLQLTSERRANEDLLHAGSIDAAGGFQIKKVTLLSNHFARFRISDTASQHASEQPISKLLTGDIILSPDPDAFFCAAVLSVDYHILRNINEASGQVTCICGAQRGIGQTLACTVRRDEVLQRVESITEARADRKRDNAPRRIGHQASHTCQLRNRLETTLGGARNRHHAQVTCRIHRSLDLFCNVRCRVLPELDHALILFLLSEQPAPIVLAHSFCFFERLGDDVGFAARHSDI